MWLVAEGLTELLEDFESPRHVFAADTADAEALEPRMLVKAKHRPAAAATLREGHRGGVGDTQCSWDLGA